MSEQDVPEDGKDTLPFKTRKAVRGKKGAIVAGSVLASLLALALVFTGGIAIHSDPATSAESSGSVAAVMSDTLPYPLFEHDCVENPAPGDVSSDNVVCFGGYAYNGDEDGGGNDIDDVLEYDIVREDPDASSIEVVNNLPSERLGLSCAEDSAANVNYCFGGFEYPFGDHLDEIFQYNATLNNLQVMNATLQHPRMSHSCVESSSENAAYCFGGYNNESGSNNYVTEISRYDFEGDALNVVSGVDPYRRIGHSCAEDRRTGDIYCFGGYNGTHHTTDIRHFNASMETLTTMDAELPSPRSGLSCTESLVGRIYCFGGYNTSTVTDDIVEFNPENDSVEVVDSLPGPIFDHACAEDTSTESRGSNIYCMGGSNGSYYMDSIYRYTYATSAPIISCESCINPRTAVVGEAIEINPTIESQTDTPITDVRICKTSQCSASEDVEEEDIICESAECTYTSQSFEQTDVYVWARDQPGNTAIERIGSISFRLGRGEFCSRDEQCLGGDCRDNACLGGYPPPIVEFLG